MSLEEPQCRETGRLLDMADVTERPDRLALMRHLRSCPRCAARWPEIRSLLESADRPSSAAVSVVARVAAPVWRRPSPVSTRVLSARCLTAAAAVLLVALTGLWLVNVGAGSKVARPAASGEIDRTKPEPAVRSSVVSAQIDPSEPGLRRLPVSASTLVRSTVIFDRDRRLVSRMRRSLQSRDAVRLFDD